MIACICGGVIEGLIALIIIVFSFLIGKVTTHCNERCCKNKKAIDKSLSEFKKIGYKDGSDG